ncbi:MAG TPA: hypothetical protein PK702_07290 [Burkholderiaceae bacterium]|nr:hypothetical protein [Burkholderiaceae bacterium]
MCKNASTIPITVSVEGLAHHARRLHDQQAGSLWLKLRNDDLLWRFEYGGFNNPIQIRELLPFLAQLCMKWVGFGKQT